MKKARWSLYFLMLFSIAVVLSYFSIFTVSKTAQLNINQDTSEDHSLQCFENPKAEFIDSNGQLDILVWNIYKQSQAGWKETLELYTKNANLALLQEVSMDEHFISYTKNSHWFSSHVDAFSVFGLSTGVLTLSTSSPLLACAHIEFEPWLQLPKSGIYATFHLSDGRELVVVNLHSVNFTYGVQEYEKQIKELIVALKKHKGPIIFAGDLNAWSLERIATIEKTIAQLGLKEVRFEPDNRKQFINGLALDYVFYRGLKLIDSKSPITDASDHNPLLVKFKL